MYEELNNLRINISKLKNNPIVYEEILQKLAHMEAISEEILTLYEMNEDRKTITDMLCRKE